MVAIMVITGMSPPLVKVCHCVEKKKQRSKVKPGTTWTDQRQSVTLNKTPSKFLVCLEGILKLKSALKATTSTVTDKLMETNITNIWTRLEICFGNMFKKMQFG